MKVALRKESVDRNLFVHAHIVHIALSLSARRAWIEIVSGINNPGRYRVALRKESVDRNQQSNIMKLIPGVALRKESVDRNLMTAGDVTAPSASLSARRAWIEIEYTLYCPPFGEVALRKESVDRNW